VEADSSLVADQQMIETLFGSVGPTGLGCGFVPANVGDVHGHSRVGPEEYRQPRQLNIKRKVKKGKKMREKKENIIKYLGRNSANGAMNEINLARFRLPHTFTLFAAWAWGFWLATVRNLFHFPRNE
jgi:hypothetical protein